MRRFFNKFWMDGLIVASFIYAAVTIIPFMQLITEAPKELGNFSILGSYLSGILSPVIFIWLIVGYILSRNQDKKAGESLELTRRSLDHQIAIYEADRLERYRANQPNFIDVRIQKYHLDHGLGASVELNGIAICALHLTNIGSDISQVLVEDSNGICCSEVIPFIKRDTSARIKTGIKYFLVNEESHKPLTVQFWLHYIDSSGSRQYANLQLYWTSFFRDGYRLPQASLAVGETSGQYSADNRNLDKEPEGVD